MIVALPGLISYHFFFFFFSDDENSTYAGCILSIFNSKNDLEKEVREIKRDVNYTFEMKIDETEIHACADI